MYQYSVYIFNWVLVLVCKKIDKKKYPMEYGRILFAKFANPIRVIFHTLFTVSVQTP